MSTATQQHQERFAHLFDHHSKVLFAFIEDTHSQLVHDVRVSLRGKADVFVAGPEFQKKLVALHSDKATGELKTNVALIFTSETVESAQTILKLHKLNHPIEIINAGDIKDADIEAQMLAAITTLAQKSLPEAQLSAAAPHAVFNSFKTLLAASTPADFIVEDFDGQKIAFEILEQFERKSCASHFGPWTDNIEQMSQDFANAKPFGHVKIDNFLDAEYAEALYKAFPTDIENWHKYNNPIEVKYANDNLAAMPECIRDVFYMLSNKEMTDKFSQISGIENLEYDPYLNGGGLHAHPRNGRLHIHLDYERHPKFEKKDRRLNIILFLTKDWKEEWGGDNQLYDEEVKNCMVRTYPKFNSAVVFQTNDVSWHGLPDSIKCPEGTLRKSLAYYYLSPALDKEKSSFGADGSGLRHKAAFCKRPQDEDLPQMQKLYALRPKRRIEPEDMKEIWPEWTPELF